MSKKHIYISIISLLLIIAIAGYALIICNQKDRNVINLVDQIKTTDSHDKRVNSSEGLYKLVTISRSEISEGTIDKLIELLDIKDDSARYWIARSVGALGSRGYRAVPKLKSVLNEVDCIKGSKTSASGIRFALVQIGEREPSYKICK